jgi:hypothetical protein
MNNKRVLKTLFFGHKVGASFSHRITQLGLMSLIGFSSGLMAAQDSSALKSSRLSFVSDKEVMAQTTSPDRALDLRVSTQLAASQLEDIEHRILLAEAETDTKPAAQSDGPSYETCARYAADRDADLGDVLKAGCEPTLAQMSALMDNPIGNVAMMFNQFDMYNMKEPNTGTEEIMGNYMALFQFPKKLNENWNLINRVVLNIPSMPLDQDKIDDSVPPFDFGMNPGNNPSPPTDRPLPVDVFSGRTTSYGDIYYVGLFAPNDPIKLDNGAKLLLGAGFDLGFPSADEDMLGTGKYSAGPSALGVYLGETFKGGALVQHYWDYAGDSDRTDVNTSNIQYLYYWSLSDTVSIGAGPNVIIDWEQNNSNRWTVPVGFGINKTFQMGKVPVRIGIEYYQTVIEPDDIVHNESSWRLYIIPAVPSALFDWMQ